ncbi:MAG TPA: hypothetical protein VFC63_10100 [Blastocatellia bacterium]|nr:hypothetical protein [Blastocatellia bacterium]
MAKAGSQPRAKRAVGITAKPTEPVKPATDRFPDTSVALFKGSNRRVNCPIACRLAMGYPLSQASLAERLPSAPSA